jgi:nicotinamidase/pyrazinamidase
MLGTSPEDDLCRLPEMALSEHEEAQPMPHDLSYDEKTAVIVVDVQNDFADPEGSLYVPDGAKTIPFINEQIARARGRRRPRRIHAGVRPSSWWRAWQA